MENIVSGIYQIVNLVNGKRYIGSSKDIANRRREHFHLLLNNKHHSVHLQRAWNKYGQDCFEFSIVEQCPCIKEILIEREQYYIDQWKPEYNIAPKAVNGLGQKHTQEFKNALSKRMQGHKYNVGRKTSDETKLKMSLAHKGKKFTQEHIDKVAAQVRGRKHSLESRTKMSEHSGQRGKPGYWLGATFSEERLKKMSDSHLGHHHTEEDKEKMRLAAKNRSPEYLLEIANKKRASWKKRKKLKEQDNE